MLKQSLIGIILIIFSTVGLANTSTIQASPAGLTIKNDLNKPIQMRIGLPHLSQTVIDMTTSESLSITPPSVEVFVAANSNTVLVYSEFTSTNPGKVLSVALENNGHWDKVTDSNCTGVIINKTLETITLTTQENKLSCTNKEIKMEPQSTKSA